MRSKLQRPKAGVCPAVVCAATVLMAALILLPPLVPLLPPGAHRFKGKTSQQRVSAVQSRGAAFPRLSPSTAAELNPNSFNQNGDKSKPTTGLAGLPLEAQSSISRLLGRDLPGYQARTQGDGFAAENARHKLAADFTPAGVELRTGKAFWKLALRSYGYGNALQPVPKAVPRASSNRVEYRRGTLTEWYVNGPVGLEQGFTLNARPSPATVGVRLAVPSFEFGHTAGENRQSTTDNSPSLPLTIALGLVGNLTAAVDQGRTGLTLTSSGGQAALRYTGLAAHDSTGKELRAWLEVLHEQLLLKVEDARARYPVVIDPIVLVQVANLTASGGMADDFFGGSVAVSGNTAVAGAVGTTVGGNQNQGAACVFVEPTTGWANMTQTAKLTASDGAADDFFGSSVAISGNTVVIGRNSATVGGKQFQGAAYVFIEPASGWANMTQTAKLTASDGAANDELGASVAISGNTVVAGAPQSGNGGPGAAYVFVEPASGWANMTHTAKLTASDGAASDELGRVAISGNTVVAGAPCEPFSGVCGPGAAYVFVEPASGWADMTQTAKLLASDGVAQDQFGVSVAISSNTVLGGAGASNRYRGAAYVFVKPGSGWANMAQTAKLTASDGVAGDALGFSVALSGSTAMAGASGAAVGGNSGQGSAYVFVKPATGWADMTQTAKLTASDGNADDNFGSSAAMSGNTVLAGASGANQRQGAAYVFGPTTFVLSKTSLSFLLRTVSTTSLTQTVRLTNVARSSLDITGVTLTGTNTGDFAQSNNCGSSLPSGKSCDIGITFTPTAQGTRTAWVSIADGAVGSPQLVFLTGRGTFLQWSPRYMNMGNQKVGTSSVARTVTLTNAGTVPITLFSIGIAGVNPGDFGETTDCGSSLKAGASCTIQVTFTPTAVGGRIGHVAIRNSAFDGMNWVGLLGKGT